MITPSEGKKMQKVDRNRDMVHINKNILVVILKVNGLNISIKRTMINSIN